MSYPSFAYDFAKLQDEVRQWANANFGDVPSWQPLLGVQEEAGELCHAFLKREQQIRGDREKHNHDMRDAVGDIVIYLLDFCSREGIDFEQAVRDTWATVQRRDWKANPATGVQS
jgi:NTP pyrophosphatase (non-canonical NTP hydrolase)